VGTSDKEFRFLYEISWGPRETFTVKKLRQHGPRGPKVLLLEGAGDQLVRFGPLIRPLVELHWTRMVAGLSGVGREQEALHRHLFGAARLVPPKALRDAMADWQSSRCFYCEGHPSQTSELDHFVPVVRGGIDVVENMVLTDRRCNNDKRDILAASPHVARWTARNISRASDLLILAARIGWHSDPNAALAIARSVYGHLPSGGTPMWSGVHRVALGSSAEVLSALRHP